jgi:hypothetical protein
MTEKINLEDLEIKIESRKPVGMMEDYAVRVEELVFTAYLGSEVGHLTIDRFTKPTKEESENAFFTDLELNKPRPWLFYMGVKEEVRGNRIAGAMVEFANEYYKSNFNTPLHSGTINSPDAIKVWERLVRQDKAEEYVFEDKRRWRLL